MEMEKLSTLLSVDNTYESAFNRLEGQTLGIERPHNIGFKVIAVKKDYFVGEWQEKVNVAGEWQYREFFAKFDMKLMLYLTE
jgi:hypothetical protein